MSPGLWEPYDEIAGEGEPQEAADLESSGARTLVRSIAAPLPVARLMPVALLACLMAAAWWQLSLRGRPSGRRGSPGDEVTNLSEGWEPAVIMWATHPDKCWDVSRPWGFRDDGMEIQLWDCLDHPDKFLIPSDGFGFIRLAANPAYCLDAPVNQTKLQFWKCSEAPRENLLFTLPKKGRVGLIKPLNNGAKCADVPDGNETNMLQQWDCGEHVLNMMFVVHWPVNCTWTDWSDWSDCSPTCKRTRSRTQFPTEDNADNKGCDGFEQQLDACNTKDCAVPTPAIHDPSSEKLHVGQLRSSG